MLNNSFTARYRSIPIACYHCLTEGLNQASMEPQLENHREFEMILIKKGHGKITANGDTFTAKEGSLLFFSPYMLHSIEIPAGEAFEHICLCFDLSLLPDKELASRLEENRLVVIPHIPKESIHNGILGRYITDTYEAVSQAEPYWEMEVRGNLSLLFSAIMRSGLTSKPSPLSKETGFCLRVLEYIKEHYRENINSASAATALFYNNSYFCRLFRKNFGICFSRYLMSYRINKSKELLTDRNLSIADIALESGFSDSSYYVKSFRSLNGMTPGQFRETYCGR